MTEEEKHEAIEKAARAMWHATGGAQVWETLEPGDELRDCAMSEAEAALEAVDYFALRTALTAAKGE